MVSDSLLGAAVRRLVIATLGLLTAVGASAQQGVLAPVETSVDQIMHAVKNAGGDSQGMSIVRESVLRESAALLGARQGLRDKSCAIRAELVRQTAQLDRDFRFNELMMGRGILPPSPMRSIPWHWMSR